MTDSILRCKQFTLSKKERSISSTLFIDVREPYEFVNGHVPGAINIPPAQIMYGIPSALVDVDKDTQLILYCRSGARSNASMYYLRQYGFTNLVNGINKDQVMARFSAEANSL